MRARGSIEPAVTGLSFLCRSCDPEPNPPSYSEDVVRATLDYLTRSFSGNARSLVAVLAKTPVSCCCCRCLCWLTPSHCDCNNNCKIFTLLGSALICTFMHLFFCSDVMSSCAWRILSHSLFLYVLSVVVFVIRERFAKKLNRA